LIVGMENVQRNPSGCGETVWAPSEGCHGGRTIEDLWGGGGLYSRTSCAFSIGERNAHVEQHLTERRMMRQWIGTKDKICWWGRISAKPGRKEWRRKSITRCNLQQNRTVKPGGMKKKKKKILLIGWKGGKGTERLVLNRGG